MSSDYKTIEFCSQCLSVFGTRTKNPERCTKCGSAKWQEMKRYTKGANDHQSDGQDSI